MVGGWLMTKRKWCWFCWWKTHWSSIKIDKDRLDWMVVWLIKMCVCLHMHMCAWRREAVISMNYQLKRSTNRSIRWTNWSFNQIMKEDTETDRLIHCGDGFGSFDWLNDWNECIKLHRIYTFYSSTSDHDNTNVVVSMHI